MVFRTERESVSPGLRQADHGSGLRQAGICQIK